MYKYCALTIVKLSVIGFLIGYWSAGLSRAQDSTAERLVREETKSSAFEAEILRLRSDLDSTMRDQATMKGEGIGAVTLLGLLDALQLLLLKRKNP